MEETDRKEKFCGACAAIPLALAGSAGVAMNSKSYKKNKKLWFYIFLFISLLSVGIMVYYMRYCKNCKQLQLTA